ncbi:MAG: hypothetical protein ACHQEM_11355, partial [Chitinophagales bacterium]
MKLIYILAIAPTAFLFSCNKSTTEAPPYQIDSSLDQTIPLSNDLMKEMEGIYTLASGDQGLGTQFVCKVSKSKVSFFSNKNGIYIILACGFNSLDSSIRFSGFWRYSESTSQGLINFTIPALNGGADFIKSGSVGNMELNGNFSASNNTQRIFTLHFLRTFSDYAINNEFMIFAHHGVQTSE